MPPSVAEAEAEVEAPLQAAGAEALPVVARRIGEIRRAAPTLLVAPPPPRPATPHAPHPTLPASPTHLTLMVAKPLHTAHVRACASPRTAQDFAATALCNVAALPECKVRIVQAGALQALLRAASSSSDVRSAPRHVHNKIGPIWAKRSRAFSTAEAWGCPGPDSATACVAWSQIWPK